MKLSSLQGEQLIWSTTGHQGRAWRNQTLFMTSPTEFQVRRLQPDGNPPSSCSVSCPLLLVRQPRILVPRTGALNWTPTTIMVGTGGRRRGRSLSAYANREQLISEGGLRSMVLTWQARRILYGNNRSFHVLLREGLLELGNCL